MTGHSGGKLLIFCGLPGSGKSRLMERAHTGKEALPVDLGESPHAHWKKVKPETLADWIDKLARGRNLLLHWAFGNPYRMEEIFKESHLSEAINAASEVVVFLVVAKPGVTLRRNQADLARNHAQNDQQPDRISAPAELGQACERWLGIMRGYADARTIVVDSTQPELKFLDFSEWPELRKSIFGV